MKIWIKRNWRLGAALILPAMLTALFYLLRDSRSAMDLWVYGVAAPVEQALGRLWALVPFSGMELLIALFVLGNLYWLVRTAVLAVRSRKAGPLVRRLLALGAVWLWLWCAFCWLWNAACYASTFAQRSGLEDQPHSVEELTLVTAWFAREAARLSDQVPRDEEGQFLRDQNDWFANGVGVYDALEETFPCLEMDSVRAKPLVCSRLQSILGFTGMYFPFTGEANVNVDAPACLIPATIAHEMAHQRMVSSELEANFVGIAACLSSEDVVFQYSGYLMGLIQLCNALYPVDGEGWYAIAQTYFTPQLSQDWDTNNAYWAALESPVEEAAGEAYDSFLKGNGQELGIQSYGACVDLLVTYYYDQAAAWAEQSLVPG